MDRGDRSCDLRWSCHGTAGPPLDETWRRKSSSWYVDGCIFGVCLVYIVDYFYHMDHVSGILQYFQRSTWQSFGHEHVELPFSRGIGHVTFRGSWAFAGPVGNSARPKLRAHELSVGFHPCFGGVNVVKNPNRVTNLSKDSMMEHVTLSPRIYQWHALALSLSLSVLR